MNSLSSISAVIVVDDELPSAGALNRLNEILTSQFTDVETIFVVNGSSALLLALKNMLSRMPDTTCLALGTRLDRDAAGLLGMENAVGDYILLIMPGLGTVAALSSALDQIRAGFDVVFTDPISDGSRHISVFERIAYWFLSWMTGTRLSPELIQLALLSREAALYVLSKPDAEIILKGRSLAPGFATKSLRAELSDVVPLARLSPPRRAAKALRLLVSIGSTPVRFVGVVAMSSSLLSLLYAGYVVTVYLFKPDVEKGWTTLSLQVSGMMFLFSVMFSLLSEYVVQIHGALMTRRRRLIVRELRSELTRRSDRLNVVDETGQYRLGATTTPSGAPMEPGRHTS
jgi:hypothetical protein